MPSVSKWMPYEAVKECEIHMKLKREAEEWLDAFGFFEVEEVIEKTGFKLVSPAVRWDYIVRWIEEGQPYFLIPVAASFFPKTRKEKAFKRENEPTAVPEKYIATGYGKRTAGYVAGNRDNEHFVRYQIKTNANRGKGKMAKTLERARKADNQGIPVRDLLPPESFPQIEGPTQ